MDVPGFGGVMPAMAPGAWGRWGMGPWGMGLGGLGPWSWPMGGMPFWGPGPMAMRDMSHMRDMYMFGGPRLLTEEDLLLGKRYSRSAALSSQLSQQRSAAMQLSGR